MSEHTPPLVGRDQVALPRRVVPAAPCDICGTMVAPSTLQVHHANGRKEARACRLCSGAIDEIRKRFQLAQSRARVAFEDQLFRVVREVRTGVTDLPTFDQPDLA
ncbi:hypothetical protein [Longimicrobium sp.]|uniref:hypothetical protein n=1 Tax=Longimicrobium sp. TaxID=2029185 RepID=UPI002E378D48|nr:hypothetical protein [Longimicrobium sp.]HEX6038959.1 hypothetical protein [Longimicrobium sp.]